MNKYEICIEPKEYHTPKFCPSIDDECEQLIDCILDKNDVYFSDIAHEIADNAIHIYYPDLLKVLESSALSEYIGRAINEFDLRPEDDDGFNFIMKTIQWGECLYYDEQLHENFKTIIQNTIIPEGSTAEIKYGNKVLRVGAKVIQRANNYEKNVFNGEIGYITKIGQVIDDKNNNKESVVTVDFGDKTIDFSHSELANLDLAYCLTCHLTQGSGFKNVIIIIDNTHYKLLDRCMLYTAITRAKTKCALIAEPSAFQRCLDIQASQRNTWLSLISKENN